jgi:ribosomal subunit interface protein
MKITTTTRDIDITGSLREYVENRLAFALSRFQNRIRGVVIVLSDVNGPKNGIDKRCLLKIRPRGLSEFTIEEIESDFQSALNRAADRAKRTLARRLQRRGDRAPVQV